LSEPALQDGREPSLEAAEILADLVQRPGLEWIGIHSSIIVNDGIRAKTERQGLKIYERPTPQD